MKREKTEGALNGGAGAGFPIFKGEMCQSGQWFFLDGKVPEFYFPPIKVPLKGQRIVNDDIIQICTY